MIKVEKCTASTTKKAGSIRGTYVVGGTRNQNESDLHLTGTTHYKYKNKKGNTMITFVNYYTKELVSIPEKDLSPQDLDTFYSTVNNRLTTVFYVPNWKQMNKNVLKKGTK
ncbi:hypothetical protein LP083-2_177 [Listeria phage LP-083-2]|uniref:Uncharacterized protein n=3 Tax=Pecentumvirus TaxID=1857844 RepID=A0A059T6W7_9CAUD|nr:hypothetical protein LP083-2_177 [Listeria phage LP-083-2]YP_009784610.1 hypothetical protein QLX40_gp098 [Listeria phage LP-124]AHL19384.1 hypothetical protein LP083-2_177 [Listeria phage LP-083-2]AHL19495.1 hypothetical protein LP124_098 [Listeria phage LP-124]QDK05009.2 hypothetical protein FK486_0162 [Listeria phage LP-066]